MVPFYYYLLAVPLLVLLGAISHIGRGLFNIFPDRGYTNTPRDSYSVTDDLLSGNYSFSDFLLGTEYDENGYYDLGSLKNLRIACQSSLVGGMILLIAMPGFDQMFRTLVDAAAHWLVDIALYRLENLELL